MASFDNNALDDLIYALLNVVGVTATVANTNIWANRIKPGTEPTYPMVQYQTWGRFKPSYVINNGKVSHRGTYRVVGWTQNDPRAAKTLAKAIEDALVLAPASYPLVGGSRRVINFRVDPDVGHIYDEVEREDGKVYIQAGAVYEIEVES